MIKVNLIKSDETINGLEVSGHADSAQYGNDMICAAVSAIITGGFNAFNDNDFDEIELKEGYAKVKVITENGRNADYFVKSIDSCALYVNASTRFTDGGEFGLGAEIGISTQKLHVRGPMGLSALTTEKYIIKGDGQVR